LKIETLQVSGFLPAIIAMRNPMDSWARSDTYMSYETDRISEAIIGEKDRELSLKLQNAGPEHCKHLRMIVVWANIVASRYWWIEADTYRMGMEKISCSTMHKLMARPLTIDDFEHENGNELALNRIIEMINGRMKNYQELIKDSREEEAKKVWREIIQLLPQSYLQRRTVMMSYATLRNIVRQRQNHKLAEWKEFISWCKTLPNSWMIFD